MRNRKPRRRPFVTCAAALSGAALLGIVGCNKNDEQDARPLPVGVVESATGSPTPTSDEAARKPAEVVAAPRGDQPSQKTDAKPATPSPVDAGANQKKEEKDAASPSTATPAPTTPKLDAGVKVPSQDCLNKCNAELSRCVTNLEGGLPNLSRCQSALESCKTACQ